MPIQGSTILTGATISATGGTTSTLTLTGAEVKHGLQVADVGVADFRVRPFINFKQKQPVLHGTKYNKGRNEAMACMPKILASGEIAFPLVRLILEPHPEQTDAEVTKLLTWAAQLAYSSAFANFFKLGSLA